MTKDHVIPRCLYPKSKHTNDVQFVTVPCCGKCNGSFTDDEPHFRDIISFAGPINEPVRELLEIIKRSFEKDDGQRRVREFLEQFHEIELDGGEKFELYLGDNKRVMRIVRKVVRGLCHYRRLKSPVHDNQVVATFVTPDLWFGGQLDWSEELPQIEVAKDIFFYKYQSFSDSYLHSVWLLTFLERTRFVAVVDYSQVKPPSA